MSPRVSATFPQSDEWTTLYPKIHITKKELHDGLLSLIHCTEGEFFFYAEVYTRMSDGDEEGGHRQESDIISHVRRVTGKSFSQWLTLHLVLVVDFHQLPNKLKGKKQVNISSRNSPGL